MQLVRVGQEVLEAAEVVVPVQAAEVQVAAEEITAEAEVKTAQVLLPQPAAAEVEAEVILLQEQVPRKLREVVPLPEITVILIIYRMQGWAVQETLSLLQQLPVTLV